MVWGIWESRKGKFKVLLEGLIISRTVIFFIEFRRKERDGGKFLDMFGGIE